MNYYSPTTRNLFFLLVFLGQTLSFNAFSQDFKMGKYSEEDKSLTSCSFEPDAGAMVLSESGISYFSTQNLITEIHRRIKIFDAAKAKDQADVSIKFYAGEDRNNTTFSNLKAQVMNVEDGKEVITKIPKSDIYETDLGDGYREVVFSFPEFKNGSILEYEYKLYAKAITYLNGWTFQNSIPTLYSTYSIDIPEHLDYRFLGQGGNFVRANMNQENKYGTSSWTLEKLRSFREEPYMHNYVDYLDKVQFQLAGYKDFSNQGYYTSVLTTWQKLADEIFEIDVFNSYYRNSGSYKDMEEMKFEGETPQERAEAIYTYVQDKYTLNDERGFLPDKKLKDVLSSKVGGSTELNLLLLALLRANNIEAYAMLISTRGNGRSQLVQFPFVSQFNDLILSIKIDDKDYYLDLSEEDMPFGYLPLDCHVKGGLLLDQKVSDLFSVDLPHASGTKQMIKIQVDGDSLRFDEVVRFEDYDGINFLLKQSKSEKPESDWIKLSDNTRMKEYTQEVSRKKVIRAETKFKLSQGVDQGSDFLLIKPISNPRFIENPFKVDERNFPIDFNYTFADTYIANIAIPEGYVLDDFPEQTAMVLPGEMARFLYSPKQSPDGKSIQVTVSFSLNTKIVSEEYYTELKSFIEFYVKKLQEPVVLKKTS
ncbi:hypothetical protein GCM10007049_30200 [Echinicola pacifica]|uniref:DUF3857 domain-containing protein n=1 Tax=Echinicola pacifica TaxID=346377 RepID=A0A918UTT2_9BACT|nr:DUF3857 domain-containing protein [Echinicola pacifica]GGZ34765.1 hypothetical protein GCM10007049_30200 [Echinicola pacifica]